MAYDFPLLEAHFPPGIRHILIRRNKKLDEDEKAAMEGADRERVEEAARIEGITFEQAMERRKGFRYLY